MDLGELPIWIQAVLVLSPLIMGVVGYLTNLWIEKIKLKNSIVKTHKCQMLELLHATYITISEIDSEFKMSNSEKTRLGMNETYVKRVESILKLNRVITNIRYIFKDNSLYKTEYSEITNHNMKIHHLLAHTYDKDLSDEHLRLINVYPWEDLMNKMIIRIINFNAKNI